MEIWIEGNLNLVTPLFASIGPLLQNEEANELP